MNRVGGFVLLAAIALARAPAVRAQTQPAGGLGGQAEVRLPIAGAREVTGEQYAWLEVSAPRAAYFAGEPIHLTLSLGLDVEFMQTNLLQLFTKELDVPVQLQVPWIADLPGARALAGRAPAPKGRGERWASVALNDSITEARRVEDRERGGRRFAVFAIEREYCADASERLAVPAPHMRFARATRFEKNLIADPVPLDWQLAMVAGNALELRIEPLPEAGRPLGFSGGVGQLTLGADVGTPSVSVGESFKLVLSIGGDGNVEFVQPPRLDDLEGLHVRGVLDEMRDGQRVLTYDLAAQSTNVEAVPSIALAYFDTRDPAGYRTLRTASIPLSVRPAPNGSHAEPSEKVATGADSQVGKDTGHAGVALSGILLALSIAVMVALALSILLVVVRLRGRGRSDESRKD